MRDYSGIPRDEWNELLDKHKHKADSELDYGQVYHPEQIVVSEVKKKSPFSFDIDLKFWVIIPAMNINIHSKTLEFEWLCFAMYIDFKNK